MAHSRTRWAVGFLLLAVAFGGFLLWSVTARGTAGARIVAIPAGASRWQIARQLSQGDIVPNPAGFALYSLLHRRQTLKAGTYRFAGSQSAREVFAELAGGRFYALVLTVPEGFNRFDIAREVARLGLATPSVFLQATADPSSIRDLDPAAVSLEGYLFPATYRIPPRTPVPAIIALMTARFRQELKDEQRQGLAPPADLHRWVTIASLVEKETAVPAERPVIAGVFDNRLARGLPLQCDPTVIYAALLGNRYDGAIHRADLQFASPYNTYKHVGLPPGPIANPGRAALLAAAHPTPSDFLYFVSNGQGAHRFSHTLAEQQANVRHYLRALHGPGH